MMTLVVFELCVRLLGSESGLKRSNVGKYVSVVYGSPIFPYCVCTTFCGCSHAINNETRSLLQVCVCVCVCVCVFVVVCVVVCVVGWLFVVVVVFGCVWLCV